MTILDVIVLLIIAGICGSLGQAISGCSGANKSGTLNVPRRRLQSARAGRAVVRRVVLCCYLIA
jgi:hypothetical protein